MQAELATASLNAWAAATDHRSVFSAGSSITLMKETTVDANYNIEEWLDPANACAATGGNCNAVQYWDHTTGTQAAPLTVLTDILSYPGAVVQGSTVVAYKELWSDVGAFVLLANTTADTTGTVQYYDSQSGVYTWNGATPTLNQSVASGTWNLVNVNGQSIIEYSVPAALKPAWYGSLTKGIFAVESGFVRLGTVDPAGSVDTQARLNQVAVADVKANVNKFSYVYDLTAGGGMTGISASATTDPYGNPTGINAETWKISGANGQPDVVTSMALDNATGLMVNTTPVGVDPNEGRFVLDTSVGINAPLGTGLGFVYKNFTVDGVNAYQADGTIDFSMGAGFGHDVNIGVTIDDVSGKRIADYVDSGIAALIPPSAIFSSGATAPVMYTSSYRSIGDRYKVNFWTDALNCSVPWQNNATNCNVVTSPVTSQPLTALSQMINPYSNPVINGLPTDMTGTATWTDFGAVGQPVYTTAWRIENRFGVEMLYVDRPTQMITPFRTDRVGSFYTVIQGYVTHGQHMISSVDPATRAHLGTFNMDSPVSGNQMFNDQAIADIQAALGI